MSETDHPALAQEDDEVPARSIAWIALASVLVALLAIGWAYWELLRFFGPGGAPQAVRPLADARVAGLLQTELTPEREPARGIAPALRLDAFAWVDRERAEVRIPIEEAMLLVAQGWAP